MKFVNKYLRNFTPYKVASHKIWQVDPGSRDDILKLDWNEATIPPTPLVEKRIRELVDEGGFYNLYPATYNETLIKKIADYVELPEENVQYFASSDSLHEYIAKLYITVGDPVLILGPSYDNFRLTAEVCGADIYFYNIGDDFKLDREGFIEEIKEKEPSLVYICNPNNPTGNCLDVAFIERLISEFKQTLFLIDEAYMEFADCSSKELVLKYENILISRTMSKAFALANFRFGYLMASKNNIDYISSIKNPKNITTFTQVAAIAVLDDVDYMRNYVKEVKKAMAMFEKELSNYPDRLSFNHGEANFLLVKCKEKGDKEKIISYLEDNNIFVRNVSQTEMLRDYCFRITIGTTEQMQRVANVIKECLSNG